MEGFNWKRMVDRALEWHPPAMVQAAIKYKSTSYVQIDYPFIGALNRVLQLLIVLFTVWQLVSEKTWAYSETPLGTVNAFGGPGTAHKVYSLDLATVNKLSYCDNESHAFQYDSNFDYDKPECRYVVPEQLVFKGTQQVQFVTQYLENRYRGFPCVSAGAAHGARESNCENGLGGTLDKHANGQCVCKTTKTVYPLGVEEMVMSFEHTYEFPIGKFGLKDWRGSSLLDRDQVATNPKITSILPSNIGTKNFQEGRAVSLTLREWLTAAGTTLDDVNSMASTDKLDRKDPDGNKRLPYNRMTGLVITVLMRYTNGEPTIGARQFIQAEISAVKQPLAWAGPGSDRIHTIYPAASEGLGSQTFDYTDRYQQGVVFDFQPTGRVYVFDGQYVLNTFIAALVLLGVAATITDTVAFMLLPNGHSQVLAAHRQVIVNKKQGFAELGMRTALAAKVFAESFDPDHNEIIEAEDIVRVLAAVAGPTVTYKRKNPETGEDEEVPMDCEKAHAIAIAILMDQHAGGGQEATMDSFTFSDFMRTQDNGTIPFPVFINTVAIPEDSPWTPTAEQKAAVEKAWQDGLRAEGDKMKTKLTRRASKLSRNYAAKDGVTQVDVQIETPF